MTIEEYHAKVLELGFEEFPNMITFEEISLESFIDFKKANIELKIHLTKLVICDAFLLLVVSIGNMILNG